ncbi:VWA domain-containing protein [Lyngbya sp. CCY1209]|uniref:VWA domain-containing protein n=1 Tax=Lyngbya sp. CCY1209 TaxID=2886103 RepID=UPI002D20659A|nr:VWA domain-containing protein [Lyngbya sp. CCY1209]MEB3883205.1 VWA domain-containing protein [Lyngbya sp. CCY1209]
MAISLEKIEREAPALIDLAKKADISIQKADLKNHRAKVALCLDISGSMSGLYLSGKIQRLAEKILALGCQFDDNGAIDIFLFGQNPHQVGAMNLANFQNFIAEVQEKYPLEGGTYYGKVMKKIRSFYFPLGRGGSRKSPVSSKQPVYVMFVTDGATFDESETEQQMRWSSFEPIFWQFMAIGKSRKDVQGEGFFGWLAKTFASDFTFLENLDDMSDRHVDNADFFSLEDPEMIDDDRLYELLMNEYPGWVKSAKRKQLLR